MLFFLMLFFLMLVLVMVLVNSLSSRKTAGRFAPDTKLLVQDQMLQMMHC